MTIKAIIFDMDGVLVDAKDWHYEALNRALSPYGIMIDREEHLHKYDGVPTRKKLEILSAEKPLPSEAHDKIYAMKQFYTMELSYERCRPIPTHIEALAGLKQRGYKLGLASNSIRNSVDFMMRQTGLASYLDIMLSNEDVARPKPDPEMYLKAVAHFGLTPQECLIIEDNPVGIKAAVAADAHLMTVRDVSEVNLDNILAYIEKLERSSA